MNKKSKNMLEDALDFTRRVLEATNKFDKLIRNHKIMKKENKENRAKHYEILSGKKE